MSFKREKRYVVFKICDIDNYLNDDDKKRLNRIARDIATYREHDGRDPTMECVVVEKDWPEYEPTWDAIAKRVIREES